MLRLFSEAPLHCEAIVAFGDVAVHAPRDLDPDARERLITLAWAGDAAERDRIRRRAFDASLSAGAVARRRFAVDKAIALHEQALELAADAAERAPALEELADDHEAMFHMSEAVATYFEAVEAVHSAGADDD